MKNRKFYNQTFNLVGFEAGKPIITVVLKKRNHLFKYSLKPSFNNLLYIKFGAPVGLKYRIIKKEYGYTWIDVIQNHHLFKYHISEHLLTDLQLLERMVDLFVESSVLTLHLDYRYKNAIIVHLSINSTLDNSLYLDIEPLIQKIAQKIVNRNLLLSNVAAKTYGSVVELSLLEFCEGARTAQPQLLDYSEIFQV